MARVVPTAPFDSQFFGGETEITLPAADLFELVRRLDARAPGFADAVEERGLLAVDGRAVADWSAPLPADAEVLVIPRIAGG